MNQTTTPQEMRPTWVLLDDGTMDTVLRVECPLCKDTFETRYTEVPRDDNGAVDQDDLNELVLDDWLNSDGWECRCGEESNEARDN